MTSRARTALALIVTASVVAAVVLARPIWSESISMQVVDENGAPLEGVNVVAMWVLKGGLEGGVNRGVLMVREAVTDASGKFELAGWGPRFAGFLKLNYYAPGVYFFKSGYQVGITDNGTFSPGYFIRSFSENGKQLKLVRFEGSLDEYGVHLGMRLDGELENLTNERSPCLWKEIPMMIKAVWEQEKKFTTPRQIVDFRINFVDGLMSNDAYFERKGCGSVHEYMEKLGRG